MTRGLTYHPLFWDDVQQAAAWLASRKCGLPERFGEELIQAINAVSRLPLAYRTVEGPTRRALLRKFKYQVVFEVDDDAIYFVGVVHAARDFPRWLKARKEDA